MYVAITPPYLRDRGVTVVLKDKVSTGFTVIMVEEMTEALAGERQGITGDLGGVLIETSTLATMEVRLVTISGRTGSTTVSEM